ncbi:MAG: hypothetical protein HFJ35_02730 [Clostridia bacterium]|nr:hypothetical protein [Clostridia bacterium]
MENEEKQLLGTEEKNEGTVTEPVEKTEKEDIRTFTQEEVNAMLTKERKKMPSKEELQAFKEWQETQKTLEQKQAEKETEFQNALSKNAELEEENKVLKAGVNIDDVDYVVFKVAKMEGDFEENLQSFLKENPKYLKQENIENNNQNTDINLGGNHENKTQITKEEFNKMSYPARLKLYNENKTLYDQLVKN